jgi:hypothetical protein
MADIGHYRPGMLREIAETIDDWLEAAEAARLDRAA